MSEKCRTEERRRRQSDQSPVQSPSFLLLSAPKDGQSAPRTALQPLTTRGIFWFCLVETSPVFAWTILSFPRLLAQVQILGRGP